VVRPVHTRGTKKGTGDFMMEATVCLDIPRDGRVECLAERDNPLENGPFQTLGVIRPGARGTFLKLQRR
jgi:hypothetical protein